MKKIGLIKTQRRAAAWRDRRLLRIIGRKYENEIRRILVCDDQRSIKKVT